MFSAALAGPIGNAIVGRALTVVMARNSMLLGERLDAVTLSTTHTPFGELYGMVQVQSLLESMKEIYGWLLLVAILCLIGLMLRHSDIRPQKVIEPTYRVIHQVVQHSIRYSVKIRNKTNLTNKISWKN